jgi:pilus assembly protein CpaF
LSVLVKAVKERLNQTALLSPSQLANPDAAALNGVQRLARELAQGYNATAPSRGLPLLQDPIEAIVPQIVDEILGWGPLAEYMRDPEVEEIILNGHDAGFVIFSGGRKTALRRGFATPEAAVSFFNRKIEVGHGYPVNAANPHQDAQLADMSRLFVVVPPLTSLSIGVTIRRFRPVARDLQGLVDLGTIDTPLQNFLSAAVRAYQTLCIAGGTGTGKTTFLQALTTGFDARDRVITIEDTRELQLGHIPDWTDLRVRHAAEKVTEISMSALVRDALRMRPTRIILGEARGGEMVDILTACNTGHEGTLFTIHANSSQEAIDRMVTLYRMGQNLDPVEVRKELLSAVRLVVHLKRDNATGRRYVAGVTELQRLEGATISMAHLFTVHGVGPARYTGIAPRCLPLLEERVPDFNLQRDVLAVAQAEGTLSRV